MTEQKFSVKRTESVNHPYPVVNCSRWFCTFLPLYVASWVLKLWSLVTYMIQDNILTLYTTTSCFCVNELLSSFVFGHPLFW